MVLTRAMYRQQVIDAALITPGVVSQIASNMDSTADLGALFVLVNEPRYRYEMEPIAAIERQKRELRLAQELELRLAKEREERSLAVIKGISDRVMGANTGSMKSVERADRVVELYTFIGENMHLIDTTSFDNRMVLEVCQTQGFILIDSMRANVETFDPEYRVYFENKICDALEQVDRFY